MQIDDQTFIIPVVHVETLQNSSVPTESVGLLQTSIAALHTDDLPLQFNGNDFEISAEVLNDLLGESTINISFGDIDTSRCNNEMHLKTASILIS